ncbi:MAG: hypothetical protein Q8T09_08790 [Candidatus Melainabacteria bacterium]|nr:hypothetical protein [Candidatus Melainabacteria bacterium]
MSEDDEELCRLIAIAARNEFMTQFRETRAPCKLKSNTSYRYDIRFHLMPAGDIKNIGPRFHSEDSNFNMLAIQAIQRAQLPTFEGEGEVKILVSFRLGSDNLEDMKVEAELLPNRFIGPNTEKH